MSPTKTVQLGDICDVRIGRTPSRSESSYWGAGHPWLSIADMNQGRLLLSTKEEITSVAVSSCGGFLVPEGTLLMSFKLSLGKVGIAGRDMYTNEAIAALLIRDPSRVSRDYLFHALSSLDLSESSDRAVLGATLNKRKLLELSIALPSLAEQDRIASILDKADSLRRKRQEAIRLADEFLKATFIDLFGDPVTDSRGWPTEQLESLGTLDRGVSKHRPRNDPRLLGGGYPLIQTGDVANCDGYVRTFTSTYSEMGLRQSKLWPAGTLCITIAANIAKTGILLFPACFPDSVVGFSAPDRPTVEYVRFWLSFLQQTLEANAPASAQKNINLAILRELQIPVPSRDRVERFAAAVDKVEAVRQAQRLAVDEVQKLHRALEHALLTP